MRDAGDGVRRFYLTFPFLFGGTFIEGNERVSDFAVGSVFPFLFGGTFIEGRCFRPAGADGGDFPSFSEGLSLRVSAKNEGERYGKISLPFRRDFH